MMNKIASELSKIATLLSRTAGHEELDIVGRGWNEREALNDAVEEVQREEGQRYQFREVIKTKQLKAPKKPSKVKVEKSKVRKGPVEKFFNIELHTGSSFNRDILHDRRYNKQYKTQKDVLKAAKELALEYGETLRISLEARCLGETELATVIPEKGQLGEWLFICDFHV